MKTETISARPRLAERRTNLTGISFALVMFATMPLAHAAADGPGVSPTLCVTDRMYLNGQAIPLPQGYDRMVTEKLSKVGYRPAPCSTAQIRLSLEFRMTGRSEKDAQVNISIDGANGSRVGSYRTQISGRQFESDHAKMVESMALALGGVMVEIDPDYPRRLLKSMRPEQGKVR
jgi:hypothetical protein